MICKCAAMMKPSTYKTIDGIEHHVQTCPQCGRRYEQQYLNDKLIKTKG